MFMYQIQEVTFPSLIWSNLIWLFIKCWIHLILCMCHCKFYAPIVFIIIANYLYPTRSYFSRWSLKLITLKLINVSPFFIILLRLTIGLTSQDPKMLSENVVQVDNTVRLVDELSFKCSFAKRHIFYT